MDNGSPVSEDYQSPFIYAGTIRNVQIHIEPPGLNASDQKKVNDAELQAALTME
jgi:hypothetical protein